MGRITLDLGSLSVETFELSGDDSLSPAQASKPVSSTHDICMTTGGPDFCLYEC